MTQANQRWIGVATQDWDSPNLIRYFYPADVPADWYLTYYANVTMACVLSPHKWQLATAATLQQWAAQTHENFWFYLLCTSSDMVEQARAKAQFLAGKCAGLVLSADCDVSNISETSTPLLRIGHSVWCYDYPNLRAARTDLAQWLHSDRVGHHGLILVDDAYAQQVTEVQTLLTLMETTL